MADEPSATPPPIGDQAPDPLFDDLVSAAAVRDATPSVLAVVVAHEPGEWFDETLESLATQDYPRLDVLVVDAAGDPALNGRVQASVPEASVLDAADTTGFSAAVDAILDTELDPAFVLVCHDDVALAPDTVRLLVTESLRSNAGIAGPKLVDWARPDRLQHVGYVVDRFAVAADVIESDELDQEQYDAVGDVFAVPSACVLIRTDLFEQLGGFDPVIEWRGEDVDLCWRGQLAGARVLIVPDAVVRHRETLLDRTGVDDIRKRRTRHQLRTVLVTGSIPSLFVTLPALAVISTGEALIALLTGRFSHVGHVVSAWTWNLRRLGDIRRRRTALRQNIRVRRSDVRALQESGSVRINAFVRGQIGHGDGIGGASREIVSAMRTGTTRIALTSWALVLAFLVFGSRTMITDGVPAIGDFASFGGSPGDLIAEWWNGWRDRDLGAPGSVPSGVGLFGAIGWITGGSLGLVRTAWILLPVAAGLAGAWRMLAVTGSRRAQIGSLVAYLVVPLPWTALAGASAAGLMAYAVAPWVLLGLLRAQAAVPFRRADGPVRTLRRSTVGLGIALGLVGLFEPAVVIVVPILVVGLLVGGVLAARPEGAVRLVAAGVGGIALMAVFALPLLVDLFVTSPGWDLLADGRDGGATTLSLSRILRFEVGSIDRGPLLWLLAVPLAMPLLVGRSWRFELAVRCWSVALTGWGVTYAVAWGLFPDGLPDTEVLLAPAAAGVAGIAGAAVAAVEHDFRVAGFGWRQVLVPVAVGAALLAAVPSVGSLETGRWEMPRGDFETTLPFDDPAAEGSYRVLWIGDPRFLPVAARPFDVGVAWATTLDGAPTIADRHLPADDGRSALVEDAVRRAVTGETSRLGRILGGLGIRYVVLMDRLAPAPFSTPEEAVEVPEVIADALADQLDLRRIEGVNSAVEVYANTEWTSVRAAIVEGFDDRADDLFDLEVHPISGSAGVLIGDGTSLEGAVPSGTEVYVAQTPDSGWRLEVEGQSVARRRALGWASAYVPSTGGDATYTYATPWWRQAVLVFQVAVFAIAAAASLRRAVWGELRS